VFFGVQLNPESEGIVAPENLRPDQTRVSSLSARLVWRTNHCVYGVGVSPSRIHSNVARPPAGDVHDYIAFPSTARWLRNSVSHRLNKKIGKALSATFQYLFQPLDCNFMLVRDVQIFSSHAPIMRISMRICQTQIENVVVNGKPSANRGPERKTSIERICPTGGVWSRVRLPNPCTRHPAGLTLVLTFHWNHQAISAVSASLLNLERTLVYISTLEQNQVG
jgi:hypothetical protein